MPTTNLDQRLKRILNLSDDEVAEIAIVGANNEEDLKFLEFVDLPIAISLIKRRKLHVIIQYLAKGKALNATITIDQIQAVLGTVPAAPGGLGGGLGGAAAPDPNRGAPKVHIDPLSAFSGNAVDYEEWARKSESTIKQTVYKDILSAPAPAGDTVAEARSGELFNMILSCVADGHALNTIEKVRDDNHGQECGYLAWKALKDWYLDPSQKDSMIQHWESKLNSLALDVDTAATEYINYFEMYVRKLDKLGENWSDDKKVREFKAHVTDPDYEVECRVHTGNFAALVATIRKREQELDRQTDKTSKKNKRSRRVAFDDEGADSDGDNNKSVRRVQSGKGEPEKNKSQHKPDPYIPFIPKFLYSSLDADAKKNLATWRRMVNAGETMENKDLVSGSGTKDPKETSKKTGKGGAKTRRVTRIRKLGIQDDTVEIKLDSSSESGYFEQDLNSISHECIDSFGHDSDVHSKLDHSIKDVKAPHIRMVKRGDTSVGMSRGHTIQ